MKSPKQLTFDNVNTSTHQYLLTLVWMHTLLASIKRYYTPVVPPAFVLRSYFLPIKARYVHNNQSNWLGTELQVGAGIVYYPIIARYGWQQPIRLLLKVLAMEPISASFANPRANQIFGILAPEAISGAMSFKTKKNVTKI